LSFTTPAVNLVTGNAVWCSSGGLSPGVAHPGSGVVWQDTGRFVDTFDPNGDESLVWTEPHDGLVYGFLGDTSVAQKLCAALGA
jgi:hypothetical protein